MKVGKISENVLKRSVLKYISSDNENIVRGAGIGNDCALFTPCRSVTTNVSTLSVKGKQQMRQGIYGAVNNLAAAGEVPFGILLTIILPERAREIKLQEMMQEAKEICEKLQMQILGGHTETSEAVNRIVVSVTALGGTEASEKDRAEPPEENRAKLSEENRAGSSVDIVHSTGRKHSWEGYDIVVSKYIGMEAALLIAEEKEEELLTRFPRRMVEEAKGYEKFLCALPEAAIAEKAGVCLMHDIREGGIFGALWEMAQRAEGGLSVDLKKIPMKQTVVEICNYYDLNPYEILSQGCLLMVTRDGENLVAELEKQDIPAAVIGRMTDGNDRIIMNGDEVRYMDLPKPDQIHKIL